MLSTWLQDAGKVINHPDGSPVVEQDLRAISVYLREWHPYIYLWGPRGDVLAENYHRIIAKLDAAPKTTLKSFMPVMLRFYGGLSISQFGSEQALRELGEFAGMMSDAGIWSPVISCTESSHFAFQALTQNPFPNHLYWQAHFHPNFHEAVNRVFNRTSMDQITMEHGMRWFERFVLGGEHVRDSSNLGPLYAQHVTFCQEHDLLP